MFVPVCKMSRHERHNVTDCPSVDLRYQAVELPGVTFNCDVSFPNLLHVLN
jgi:hypothetical protein